MDPWNAREVSIMDKKYTCHCCAVSTYSNLSISLLSKPVCPIGWVFEEGFGCFYFETTEMTWQEARTYCKSKHASADLAEIHDAETNAFLFDYVKQHSYSYWWIGGSDKARVIQHISFHSFKYVS